MKKSGNKNVILIGFMGCGKTTIGIRLSFKLQMTVEDTDKMIERRKGCTVREIFDREGEEAFRKMETELLRDISRRNYSSILSVGGGTPVRPENRELLKKCGTVVYLRAKPETIYNRLKGDQTRPLLQCEDPMSRIRELMESRKEAYESCADLILDVDDIDMEECACSIAAALQT